MRFLKESGWPLDDGRGDAGGFVELLHAPLRASPDQPRAEGRLDLELQRREAPDDGGHAIRMLVVRGLINVRLARGLVANPPGSGVAEIADAFRQVDEDTGAGPRKLAAHLDGVGENGAGRDGLGRGAQVERVIQRLAGSRG